MKNGGRTGKNIGLMARPTQTATPTVPFRAKNTGKTGNYIELAGRLVSSIGRTGNPTKKHGTNMGSSTEKTVQPGCPTGLNAPSNMKNGGSMGKNYPTRTLKHGNNPKSGKGAPIMATNTTNRSRQPKGTSKGGQFAPETHTVAPADLDANSETPPSAVEYYDNGNIRCKEWRNKDEKLDRTDGPASITYFQNGTTKEESWCQHGVFHRTDGPAHTHYRPNGSIQTESWWENGRQHRTGAPARIEYYPDGTPRTEEWYKDGAAHRDDGPAYTAYREDGTVESEGWCQNGEIHRENGPAWVDYDPDGSIKREEYWENGELLMPPAH